MKKRKGLKIFLIILAVILAIAGGVTIWQWDNISSVMYFMKYSKEELETMQGENDEKLNSAVAGLNVIPRELTDEEREALENGTITEQDAVEISLGTSTLAEKITEKTTGQASASQQKTDRVSELIAQLYVLKSSFISKLDGLAAQATAEYKNTPKEERTSSWAGTKISKYTGLATGLEAECDAKVEAIISELKTELKKSGGDMSIINTIRSTYDSEKQIKKAYYLNKYLK